MGTISGVPVALNGWSTLAVNLSNTTNIGSITGYGSLEQNGTGTTVLTSDNSYAGTTTINAGTLQVGTGAAAGTLGSGAVTNNSSLIFNRSDSYTYGGVISGSGTLQQNGSGTTVLTGANTYTGLTTINAGTLQLGNGGTSGSLLGDIVNNGMLAINRSDSVTLSDFISGTGGLQQNGTGSTILTGNNSYKGSTTVSSGSLIVNGDQSAATGATTVASGAKLGGTGTLGGNVTIASDGILTPGSTNGTGGTLTIKGNLALNDTSSLRYTFGSVNGVSQNSLTNVGGI